jgi:hypothetical protein
MSIRVIDTPWTRGCVTQEESEALHALRMGPAEGTLSLLARSKHGPFVGRLRIEGRDEIRVEAPALVDVFRGLIARVQA